VRRTLLVALSALFVAASAGGVAAAPVTDLHLLPRPASVTADTSCTLMRPSALTVSRGIDPGALELIDERWRALGIPGLRQVEGPADVVVRMSSGAPQSYRLAVDAQRVTIDAADADGAFYAFATLAQLARRAGAGLALPCVRIADAPALRWRVLSDDVSRGPLPTMRYFRERIRTIAAFKMNGYSPYMEHVFVDPKNPLTAPADGITPAELHELNVYGRRFHVALIPEQQTFAHMHNTLRWERYAPLAELPHGYLLAPSNSGGQAYVHAVITAELGAVPHPPFFHIGSDEPSDMGRGASRALVASHGASDVFARHVLDTIALLAGSGARPMIWDDAVQAHPEIFARLPKSLVFINWHYGAEKTFVPYIERIARAGFDQMVAPGADNWNELYPDVDVALANIDRFVGEGKAADVLGLFQTVWHDDGETLYEATWYPVLYAAVSAWEHGSVDRDRFARDFPLAFFGVDDSRYAQDVAGLARARTLLRAAGSESAGDYLFWADPFDPAVGARIAHVDLSALRLAAEGVVEHQRSAGAPPLHPNAAAVMAFAARRYDALARFDQIATEARGYYDDARANIGANHEDYVYRGLYVTKYLLWEMRDELLALEPLARAAWQYESRGSHLPSVLERYHLEAQRAIARADAIDRTTVEVYERTHALPPFDEVVRSPLWTPP
jgi:hexosaminidase